MVIINYKLFNQLRKNMVEQEPNHGKKVQISILKPVILNQNQKDKESSSIQKQ